VFAVSRAFYFSLGVRFNDGPLGVYWQYLDPFLLRRRLAESLLALHAQPPLFNLCLGLALKTGQERAVFGATFLLAGLVLYSGTFLLMRRLSVAPPLAFALATWMATSPAFVAYENWLFYTLPVAAALVLAALAFARAARTGRTRDGLVFLAVVGAVSLARSLYHLVFLLAAAALLALCWRDPRRALKASALPLLLVIALYAKNAVLFGHFTPSTWTGMNLARLTTDALDRGDAQRLVGTGTLSPASLVPAFSRPADYPRSYFDAALATRVRALAWETKTTGATNFNHAAYIAISEDLQRDGRWVILHRPLTYLRSVREAWGVYFRSPADLRFLGIANIAALRGALDVYDVVFFGRWPWPRPDDDPGAPRRCGMLVAGLLLAFGTGLAAAAGRGPGRTFDRTQRLLVAFLCLTIGYVALVGNLLELGENNRFRVETDPLSLCLLGLLVEAAWKKVRARPSPVLE
jgi:hypothetical protein